MVTLSKPLTVVKPQGDYHTYKLRTVPYNANLPMYNLAVPFYNNGSVEEWLKFHKNLQAIITGQNITYPQGMYTITKSMLHGDALTAFENAKGVNGPQSKPTYKKAMEDLFKFMFLLQAYVTQTRCMC
eukprot:13478424-Ditylum_brightwellii.AAC.1